MAFRYENIPFEIVGFSEIDKHVIKSYHAIHGHDIKNYGDISKIDELPECDVCTWSFPCQDISLAGKQKGMNDGTRSNYGYDFIETVKRSAHKPKVLIMENVKNLVSKSFEDDFKEIQQRLKDIGYENHWKVLNAKHYGVAQNRERVFMVSILGGGWFQFPPKVKLTKRLKDYLEDNVDDKYYLSDKQVEQISNWNAQQNPLKNAKHIDDQTIQTITAKSNTSMNASMLLIKTWNDETKALKTRDDDMPRHRIYQTDSVGFAITTNESQQPMIAIPEATKKGYALAKDGDGVYINRPHQKRGVVQKQMIQTIKTSCDDVGVVVESKYSDYSKKKIINNIVEKESVVGTITANAMQSFNHDNCHMVVENLRIRKLTPLEAWRLMGVRDEDYWKAKNAGISDSQLYKQAGNAIVVDVLRAIFRNLI